MNDQERKRNEYLRQAADQKQAGLDLMRLQELEIEVKLMKVQLDKLTERLDKCYGFHTAERKGRVN